MAQIGGNYNPIPEHPIIPEWEDWSTQYKHSGWVHSFSDLPPEEYTKTIFNVLGTVVISGNTGSTLITNQITSVFDVQDGNFVIKATPSYAPGTNVVCALEVSGTSKTLTIPAGTIPGNYIILDTGIVSGETYPTVKCTNINPPYDARYEYQFITPETPTKNKKVYYGVRKSAGATDITASEVAAMENIIVTTQSATIQFEIKSTMEYVPYCFIIAIPKAQQGLISTYNAFGTENTFVQMEGKTLVIDGVEYLVYWEHDDDSTVYKPKNEDLTFNYTIKLSE